MFCEQDRLAGDTEVMFVSNTAATYLIILQLASIPGQATNTSSGGRETLSTHIRNKHVRVSDMPNNLPNHPGRNRAQDVSINLNELWVERIVTNNRPLCDTVAFLFKTVLETLR